MTKLNCSYLGNLNCKAIHLQSLSLIRTDAPLDNCCKGKSFSPTDLLSKSRDLPAKHYGNQSKI